MRRTRLFALAALLGVGCAGGMAGPDAGTSGRGGASGGAPGVTGGAIGSSGGAGGAPGSRASGGTLGSGGVAGGATGGASSTGGGAGRALGGAGGSSGGAGGRGAAGGGAAGSGGTAGTAGGAGTAGTAGGAGTAGSAGTAGTDLPSAPAWSWVGVVGSGQSLAVGGHGNAPAMPIGSTTQPYHNLKLSLGKAVVPPFDPTSTALSVVPLVEPLRALATGYPSPYPANIYGETYHTAMAGEITALARANGAADLVTVHTEVGEAGQPIAILQKTAKDTGTTGRAYAASLFEVAALSRLAKAQGKTYGVGTILFTHGESDAGSPTYEADMVTLWTTYNQDLPALTGQSFTIPMILTQQHSAPTTSGSTSAGTLAQWKIGVDHPGDILCAGPKYQYAYVSDQTHLTNPDYERLGEKYAEVFDARVVRGQDWQPLQPTAVSRSGRVITVTFHVPSPPMVWDTSLPPPHQGSNTAWASGKGFEVTAGGAPVAISSVAISGETVAITCGADLPASGVTVGYAFSADAAPRPNGTYRWGLLHDSDPLVGAGTRMSNPNYAVAFQLNVP
ncbi:MAG TPA: dockerin [Polyangia bacterium]|nr:dockerin [Polyangia bacterium]